MTDLHANCVDADAYRKEIDRLTAERDEQRAIITQLRGNLHACPKQQKAEAERDAARAELAAANARCAELEAELKVREGPWRDSLVAWNTYNEAYGYHGDINRPVMDAFRTGFDTGRAESRPSVDWKAISARCDALQQTLDRVTAIAEHWADCGIGSCSDSLAALFAALTPEGKHVNCNCDDCDEERSLDPTPKGKP